MNSPSKKLAGGRLLGSVITCLLLCFGPTAAADQSAQATIDGERDLLIEDLFPGQVLRADVAEIEPNNTCFTAQPINLLDVVHGSITPAGDTDWFAFACEEGEEIIVGTGPDPAGSVGNDINIAANLYWFDGLTCQFRASDSNSGPGDYAVIKNFVVPPGEAGTWIVLLFHEGGVTTGDYRLVVNCRIPLEPDMCLTTLYDSQKLSVNLDIVQNTFFFTDPIVFTPRPGFAIEDVIIDVDIEHLDAANLGFRLYHTDPTGFLRTVPLKLANPILCPDNNLVHDGLTKYYFASNEPVDGVPRFLEYINDRCTGADDDIPRGCYTESPFLTGTDVELADLRGLPLDDSTWKLEVFDIAAGALVEGHLYNWSVHVRASSQSELCPLDYGNAFPGEVIEVCLELRNYLGVLGGFQFDTQFDPNVLEFKNEVIAAGITAEPGWVCSANLVGGNKVRVICNDATPVDPSPDTQILLKLKFTVKPTAASGLTVLETLEPMQGDLLGVKGCTGTVNVLGCLRDGDINLTRTCDFDDYNCIGLCIGNGFTMPPSCITTGTGCETIAADVNGSGACDVFDLLWMQFRCLCDLPPLHLGMCEPGTPCAASAAPPWNSPVNRACPGQASGTGLEEGHEWLIEIDDSLLGGGAGGFVGLAFYDPSVAGSPDPTACFAASGCQAPATPGFIDATAAVNCATVADALALANALAADINANFPPGWTALVYDAPFDFDPFTEAIIPAYPKLQVRSPSPYELGKAECCVFSNEIGGFAGSYLGHALNERNGAACITVNNLCNTVPGDEKAAHVGGFQFTVDEGYWCQPLACQQPLTGGPLVHDPIVRALRIPDMAVAVGEEVSIPLEIQGERRMLVYGWDLIVPPHLEVLSFEPAEPIADWKFTTPGIHEGLVRMVGADTKGEALNSEGWTAFGTLKARVRNVAGTGSFAVEQPVPGFEGMRLLGGNVHVSGAEAAVIGLSMPRPNPSKSAVDLSLALDTGRHVTVKVFNVRGQAVRTVTDQVMGSGEHTITWDGRDSTGQNVSSGTYFFRVNAGDFQATRKIIRQR